MPNKKTSLLASLDHYCYRDPVMHIHEYPALYVCQCPSCADPNVPCTCCHASLSPEMAKQAGLMQKDGTVLCPDCGVAMTLNPARREAEVHVQLCTDKTIHYPEMHKAKTISDADYAAWKATLIRDELLGNYVRVPTSTVFARFSHDETALLDSAPDKFQTIMQGRVNDSAENAMRHSIPSQHKTTKKPVKI